MDDLSLPWTQNSNIEFLRLAGIFLKVSNKLFNAHHESRGSQNSVTLEIVMCSSEKSDASVVVETKSSASQNIVTADDRLPT